MKKYLHIITSLDIGGAETMLLRLIKHKSNLVQSTTVISLTNNGKIGEALEEIGVKVICLEIKSWSSVFKALLKLKKIIRNERPTIVHTWMYHANIFGGIAAYLAKSQNIIWSIRRSELTINESLSTFIVMKIGAIFSSIIPKSIVHVAESGLKNHQKYGYKSNNTLVIPNGFDLEKLKYDQIARKKIRNELNLNDNQILIGCVGRFHVSKGYETLISSSANVLKLHKNVKYLLIGRNLDKENSILIEWINKTGFSENFIMVGEKHNIPEYMNAMDVFCLSSITEGFPNVLGEAMASGLPCVATCVGDVEKITGDTAILIEPNNNELLSKGLNKILSMDSKKRKIMGSKGRRKIEKEYPINLICEKYYNLYHLILTGEHFYENI